MPSLKKFKGEYFRNILTLVSGAAVAQFVPLLISPITMRLYDPEDYGLIGIYLAFQAILAVFASSHYFHGILLQQRLKNTWNLIFLCSLIALGVAIGSVILEVALMVWWSGGVLDRIPGAMLWFMPMHILMGGWTTIYSAWLNKEKRYRVLNASRLAQALVNVVVQLVYALVLPTYVDLKPDVYGLFAALSIGVVVFAGVLGIHFLMYDRRYLRLFSFKRIRILLVAEKKYLFYSFPNDFIYAFINQIPIFVLGRFSTAADVGFFAQARRFLGLPVTVISSSVLEVFRQKAIADVKSLGSSRAIFAQTFMGLSLLGIIPTILLLCFGPELFTFVFGPKWVMTGRFAQVLGLMYYFKLFTGPLSYMYFIAGRLKEDLMIHLYMIVGNTLVMVIGFQLFDETIHVLLLFGMHYVLVYAFFLMRSYYFAKTTTRLPSSLT